MSNQSCQQPKSTKLQYFHDFFIKKKFYNFSRQIKVVNIQTAQNRCSFTNFSFKKNFPQVFLTNQCYQQPKSTNLHYYRDFFIKKKSIIFLVKSELSTDKLHLYFHEFFIQKNFRNFLVKSKLSTNKHHKTVALSQIFYQKNSIIFVFLSSDKKSSLEEYENFQALNVSMQDEINQLRAYIRQNVSSNEEVFKDQDTLW